MDDDDDDADQQFLFDAADDNLFPFEALVSVSMWMYLLHARYAWIWPI
jgi:hypothetical protein